MVIVISHGECERKAINDNYLSRPDDAGGLDSDAWEKWKVASKKAFPHCWDVYLFVGELAKSAIFRRKLKERA